METVLVETTYENRFAKTFSLNNNETKYVSDKHLIIKACRNMIVLDKNHKKILYRNGNITFGTTNDVRYSNRKYNHYVSYSTISNELFKKINKFFFVRDTNVPIFMNSHYIIFVGQYPNKIMRAHIRPDKAVDEIGHVINQVSKIEQKLLLLFSDLNL